MIVKSLIVFVLFIATPIMVINLFPSPCILGFCLFVYYLLCIFIAVISIIVIYLTKKNKKYNLLILFLIILINTVVLILLYPESEFSPSKQFSNAIEIIQNYDNLKPEDIFDAVKNKKHLLITALCCKYELATEMYTVEYCHINKNGICDYELKKYNYTFNNNKIIINNKYTGYTFDKDYLIFTDSISSKEYILEIGTNSFCANNNLYNCTSIIFPINSQEFNITSKDIGNTRVIVSRIQSRLNYGFNSLFKKYIKEVM
jgi:hypothetical protein